MNLGALLDTALGCCCCLKGLANGSDAINESVLPSDVAGSGCVNVGGGSDVSGVRAESGAFQPLNAAFDVGIA